MEYIVSALLVVILLLATSIFALHEVRKKSSARIAELEMQLKVLRNEGWITDFDSPEAKALVGKPVEMTVLRDDAQDYVASCDCFGGGRYSTGYRDGRLYILAVRPSTAYQGE